MENKQLGAEKLHSNSCRHYDEHLSIKPFGPIAPNWINLIFFMEFSVLLYYAPYPDKTTKGAMVLPFWTFSVVKYEYTYHFGPGSGFDGVGDGGSNGGGDGDGGTARAYVPVRLGKRRPSGGLPGGRGKSPGKRPERRAERAVSAGRRRPASGARLADESGGRPMARVEARPRALLFLPSRARKSFPPPGHSHLAGAPRKMATRRARGGRTGRAAAAAGKDVRAENGSPRADTFISFFPANWVSGSVAGSIVSRQRVPPPPSPPPVAMDMRAPTRAPFTLEGGWERLQGVPQSRAVLQFALIADHLVFEFRKKQELIFQLKQV